jgi:hypothetical protein
MDLCFREGATDTEDDAFTIIAADAVGGERGAVADNSVDAYLVIGGIEVFCFSWKSRNGVRS